MKMELLKFKFDDVSIYAIVKLQDYTDRQERDLILSIEDAIYSYMDAVDHFEHNSMIEDVLDSFNLDYQILSPTVFWI